MQTLEHIIADQPFFKGLEPGYLEMLTGCASNVVYKAGVYIHREGGPAEHFYIIRQGKVAIEIQAAQHGVILIETIETGDVFGWSWLFPPYRWRFNARTIEPTRAIMFDGTCLRTKCETDHDLGYELIKRTAQVVIERLQATRMQLLDVYGVHS